MVFVLVLELQHQEMEDRVKRIVVITLLLLLCTLSNSADSANVQLPPSEVKAYNDMTSVLNIPTPPSASSICNDKKSQGLTIKCRRCRTNALSNITTCHVTQILITGIDLSGFVSESISHFTRLKVLDLSYNKLKNVIPRSLGRLSFLEKLYLLGNQLNGSIPTNLGNLKNLRVFDLSFNLLSGSIPHSFVALGSLEYLDLSMNMLSGTIPDFLGGLSNLTDLWVSDNQLSGSLPSGIANMKNLEALDVSSNNLNGRIPLEYAQLKRLSYFIVGGNNMTGTIPSFKLWTNLVVLVLMGNNFEGPIPPEIFKLSSLQFLWISDLNTSSFPFPLLANLKSVYSLVLRNCKISGQIPPNIGKMSSLKHLDLSFNNITGGIPNSMQNLTFLSKMALAGNKLNGAFPDWLTKKHSLIVDLSHNNLTITETFKPHNLSNMNLFGCCYYPHGSIEKANIGFPQMVEVEPPCPNPKPKYKSLFINCGGGDKFLPDGHYSADNDTSYFHVSDGGHWAFDCSGLDMLHSYSFNSYIKKTKCGISDVDAPLYETARLCPLSLTYYGCSLQSGHYTVRLYFTELLNAEMDDYTILGNRIFDIYIQGELKAKDYNIKERAGSPYKAWNETFNVTVKDSSLKIQFLWAGKGSIIGYHPNINGPLISAISAVRHGERKVNVLKITLIAIASVIAAVLLLLFCSWKMGWLENKDLYVKRIELLGGSVTVKQLIDATRNFSQKMEIGKGGFGTVYRAELLNQIVAVKKLCSQSKQGMDEFKNEVYTLKSLKHENLVQLWDGFSEKDLHLLIYEYMENNSLARALFDSNSAVELNWETRFSICLGVAKGLKYLHKDSRLKIVHRDIKASNILLDGTLKAKISDFGLARLYYREENQNMVTIVGGTRGYMASEYAMRGLLTDKADIYSFGVLLLEIVSGKNNADYKPNQESVFLLDTAYVLHKKGRLVELVDKRLDRYNVEQARTILGLGMMCTSQSPTLRPTISEVVSVLEGDNTIEQVSADRAPTTPGSGAADFDINLAERYTTCFTDFSNTSTEVASASSTAYYVIKERDVKHHLPAAESTDHISPLEISNESNI